MYYFSVCTDLTTFLALSQVQHIEYTVIANQLSLVTVCATLLTGHTERSVVINLP